MFAGKTVSEIFSGGAQDETGDEFSHGTAVASIIAAGRGAVLPDSQASTGQGIAWGADIAMFALRAGSGGGPYHPIVLTGQSRVDERWAARITQVIDWSSAGRTLDFVNVSVGFHGIIDQYSEQELREFFGGTIAALAQSGAADRTVFVWAGGNGHGKDCTAEEFSGSPALCVDGLVNARSVEVMPGMAARIPELQGSVVAVVAVAPDDDRDGDHEIAAFSNRCGLAKDWCIAAPGVDLWAAYFGPYEEVSGQRLNALVGGTSVAAPLVTGALVVMKDFFRDELANTDLVARLLATADKSGIYADADVYGQGLLDLAAATAPAGSPSIAVAERVEGGGVKLAATALGLGDAFGDGLSRALAGREIAAFDDLGAPFWYALDSLTDTASGPSVGARLRSFMAQSRAGWDRPSWRPSLTAGPSADGASEGAALRLGMLDEPSPGEETGHLSLAGRGLTLSIAGREDFNAATFSTEGLDMRAPASGATFAWRPAGAPVAVRGGWIGERRSLLGSRATGAFGRMTASSAFAGIEAWGRFGAWRLGAGAEIGTVNATTKGGLIADVSPLTTSAFAFQAVRLLGNEGTLALSLSQPLRVESGRASLSIPIGRTKDGAVRRHAVTADLVPTGRQIDVAAQWRRALSADSELRLGAIWSRQPGHAASVEPELTLFAGWRHTF